MILTPIETWLRENEWYDNHKLAMILNCQRKAFWHTVYKHGLATGVGDGADFGSCIHAAFGVYYTLLARGVPQSQCEIAAVRAFGEEWKRRLAGRAIVDKHTQENGVRILAAYFDHYKMEDQAYRYIESEIFAIVPITPRPGETPFAPIFYVARADGIWERKSNGDWYIQETKTTSYGVDHVIETQKISRQTRGYTFTFRQFDRGHKIVGVLINAVYVGKPPVKGPSKAKPFNRDYVDYNEHVIESWRAQTIQIVTEWRSKVETIQAEGMKALDIFPQNDGHCMAFNQKCTFHKLCYTSPLLADEMEENTWTPFNVK